MVKIVTHNLPVPLTQFIGRQQELADLVGASRPVVSTILNDFREQGILAYTREHICIIRLEALERLLGR